MNKGDMKFTVRGEQLDDIFRREYKGGYSTGFIHGIIITTIIAGTLISVLLSRL